MFTTSRRLLSSLDRLVSLWCTCTNKSIPSRRAVISRGEIWSAKSWEGRQWQWLSSIDDDGVVITRADCNVMQVVVDVCPSWNKVESTKKALGMVLNWLLDLNWTVLSLNQPIYRLKGWVSPCEFSGDNNMIYGLERCRLGLAAFVDKWFGS